MEKQTLKKGWRKATKPLRKGESAFYHTPEGAINHINCPHDSTAEEALTFVQPDAKVRETWTRVEPETNES